MKKRIILNKHIESEQYDSILESSEEEKRNVSYMFTRI